MNLFLRFGLLSVLCGVFFAPCWAEAASRSERVAAKIEQMAMTMLPTNEVRNAMGFFAPVTKKYQPIFEQFNTEYLASTNKLAVIQKYLPRTEDILRDAEAMKVPEKYEAQKAAYLSRFRAVLAPIRLSMKVFGNAETK